jgi:hypothetical protein
MPRLKYPTDDLPIGANTDADNVPGPVEARIVAAILNGYRAAHDNTGQAAALLATIREAEGIACRLEELTARARAVARFDRERDASPLPAVSDTTTVQ